MNENLKTPHGRQSVRNVLRSTLFIALGAGLMLSLSASAEWYVQDREARKSLDDIDKKLASQNKVGSGDFSNNAKNGEQQGRFQEPPKKFEKSDQDRPSSADMSLVMRCPKPKAPEMPRVDGVDASALYSEVSKLVSEGIPEQQWKICKEIYETERAQFKYSVMMSDLAQKRYERLQEIQRQRGQIDNNNVGELDSNTNKMLALLTLIQIDQQQHKTYNDAYAARIAYLNGLSAKYGQMAVNGTRGTETETLPIIGNKLTGDLAAMGVMKLAFAKNSPIRAKRRDD